MFEGFWRLHHHYMVNSPWIFLVENRHRLPLRPISSAMSLQFSGPMAVFQQTRLALEGSTPHRQKPRRLPTPTWRCLVFIYVFQDCDWITLWYTNRAMENHRFNRQIPYKYSAELSRGSTCKWFRFVMVFSRGKKEMKKMWKINDGKNKWKEMKINNKLKGTRKWNKPWM